MFLKIVAKFKEQKEKVTFLKLNFGVKCLKGAFFLFNILYPKIPKCFSFLKMSKKIFLTFLIDSAKKFVNKNAIKC